MANPSNGKRQHRGLYDLEDEDQRKKQGKRLMLSDEIFELTSEIKNMLDEIDDAVNGGEIEDLESLRDKLAELKGNTPIACCID